MEGTGVNATSRITGIGKQAILRLLGDFGTVCANFHNEKMRDTKPARVECDEVWSFVFANEKSLRPEIRGTYGLGDVWLWTAIDKDSKVMISYWIGQRTPEDAHQFMQDLASRNRIAHDTINGRAWVLSGRCCGCVRRVCRLWTSH